MSSAMRLGLGAAAALLVCGMLFGVSPHPHFWWDHVPGFAAAFGFGGAWLLARAAKALGRALERGEDYYDD